jgi:hypothetical protein
MQLHKSNYWRRKMSMSNKYKELRDEEIMREVNKEWFGTILVIVYIIVMAIFIAFLCDLGQAIAQYKAITTPTINHPPIFIR